MNNGVWANLGPAGLGGGWTQAHRFHDLIAVVEARTSMAVDFKSEKVTPKRRLSSTSPRAIHDEDQRRPGFRKAHWLRSLLAVAVVGAIGIAIMLVSPPIKRATRAPLMVR